MNNLIKLGISAFGLLVLMYYCHYFIGQQIVNNVVYNYTVPHNVKPMLHFLRLGDTWDAKKHLPMCSSKTQHGPQPIPVAERWFPILQLEKSLHQVSPGGSWWPPSCRSRQRLAVVVPVRDRHLQFRIFLHHMHPFLQRHHLAYTIFMVEQTHSADFNRGMLLNVGFREATTRGGYDCLVIHDLDMLPEDDRIPYECTDLPRHLSEARSKFNYSASYKGYIGGVLTIRPEQYQKVNGFSNAYFGWGTEDDDFRKRLQANDFKIAKVPLHIGKYRNVKHEKAEPAVHKRRKALLAKAEERLSTDGLSSLKLGEYSVLAREDRRLFTWILVNIDQERTLKSLQIDKLLKRTARRTKLS